MRKLIRLFITIISWPLLELDLRFILRESPIDSLRSVALKLLGSSIGKDTYIRSNFFITNPSMLQIGHSSRIARNCSLYLYDKLVIGNYVHVGSGLTIHTSEHIIHSDYNLPIVCRGSIASPVLISDNVYIGSNVTILSGVSIESNVVVAAGSVVVSSLSSGFIYGGIPAKILRKLSD